MNLGGYSATGPRDSNEDNYYIADFSDVHSFTNGVRAYVMVSDGMGGYHGGDVASGIAVSCAESYIGQLLEMAKGNQIEFDAQYALGEISQNAHDAILEEIRERGSTRMGATFIGAFLSPTHAWIGHVGDSRAYLIREGAAIQLTEDHSQVGRMLSRGLITEEEAQNHPARNRIERALGFSDATPDVTETDLQPGDALLLCSDGVYTVLNAQAIADCVMRGRDAEKAAVRTVKTALHKGTDDNTTAVVACVGDVVQKQSAPTVVQPTGKVRPVGQSGGGPSNPHRDRASAAQPADQVSTRQYQLDNYRGRTSQKRPATQRGVTPRRAHAASPRAGLSGKSIAIIAVAVVVLAGALALAILRPGCDGGTGATNASGGAGVATSSATNVEAGAGAKATEASSGAETPGADGFKEYPINGSAIELKFVDFKDRAHTFNERIDYSNPDDFPNPFGDGMTAEATLKPGETVWLSSGKAKDYGVGGPFRDLRDTYRKDLVDDCERRSENTYAPGSGLSLIVDDTSYRALLDDINQSSEATGRSVDSIVKTLIVDSAAFETE